MFSDYLSYPFPLQRLHLMKYRRDLNLMEGNSPDLRQSLIVRLNRRNMEYGYYWKLLLCW
jgi:hypothetical protein